MNKPWLIFLWWFPQTPKNRVYESGVDIADFGIAKLVHITSICCVLFGDISIIMWLINQLITGGHHLIGSGMLLGKFHCDFNQRPHQMMVSKVNYPRVNGRTF